MGPRHDRTVKPSVITAGNQPFALGARRSTNLHRSLGRVQGEDALHRVVEGREGDEDYGAGETVSWRITVGQSETAIISCSGSQQSAKQE